MCDYYNAIDSDNDNKLVMALAVFSKPVHGIFDELSAKNLIRQTLNLNFIKLIL